MIDSLFRFHVYYQTRRILKEISAALPQDASGMLSATAMSEMPMNNSAKSLMLTLTPIGDKNKAKTKSSVHYITTGQMMDTIRLEEFNMTARVILLLNALQMKRCTSTTSVKVQRPLKLGAHS